MQPKQNNTNKIIFASSVSVVGNLILAILKIVFGYISGSIAVVSDGVDSASDVVISVIMLITAKIMNRPPDKRFVYGYGKAEGIATKILSFVIFYAGIQMFISAVKSIASGQGREMPDKAVIYVIVISIVVKLLLSLHQTIMGKRLNSSMLIANGVNMRNDIIISVGVLVGLIFTFVFEMPIMDGITALVVSIVIIRSAISIFIDAGTQLMDGVQDEEIYNKIFKAVEQVEEAHNPHKVRSRSVGNQYVIVLDIEVDGKLTIHEGHNIANRVETAIREVIPEIFDIIVHVEPLGLCQKDESYGVTQE